MTCAHPFAPVRTLSLSLGRTRTPPAPHCTYPLCLPHQVDPRIGPYSFTVDAVQQDRQGFVYLLVTQPFDQSTLVSRIYQLYG